MERLVVVEFGPSRSRRFGRALVEARSRAGECTEVEPGRYRASFLLGEDSAAYTALASLLERVRHWRATEVYEGDEPVSAYHAKEMAWCASSQLKSHGACRFRFFYGVLPRCSVCPLFDAERAIRDVLGENPPPGDGARDHPRLEPSRAARWGAPSQAHLGIRPGLRGPGLPTRGVARTSRRRTPGLNISPTAAEAQPPMC